MTNIITFLLSAILLACSSYPISHPYVAAFFSAILLAFGLDKTRFKKTMMFLWGLVFNCFAMYWIPESLVFFGKISTLGSYLFFSMYCIVSSVQFVCFAYFYEKLEQQRFLSSYYLSLPAAWLLSSMLIPRLFPWTFAASFIEISLIAGIASLLGTTFLGAIIIWWAQITASIVLSFLNFQRLNHRAIFSSVVFTGLLLATSSWSVGSTTNNIQRSSSFKVGLVQANINSKDKEDILKKESIINIHKSLSEKLVKENEVDLLVWPETVISSPINDKTNFLDLNDHFYPDLAVPLIFGGTGIQEYKSDVSIELGDVKHQAIYKKRYNAAFLISPAGQVLGRYYKRYLVPFGEFLPLASTAPSIRSFFPRVVEIISGDKTLPIEFQVSNLKNKVKAAFVICYEDLFPKLARESNANLLINLTDDGWYGTGYASFQHNLIAKWRAVETGKYFIRATNTGVTSVTSPLGQTVAELAPFKRGVLHAEVSLMSDQSIYSKGGYLSSYILSLISIIFILKTFLEARYNKD